MVTTPVPAVQTNTKAQRWHSGHQPHHCCALRAAALPTHLQAYARLSSIVSHCNMVMSAFHSEQYMSEADAVLAYEEAKEAATAAATAAGEPDGGCARLRGLMHTCAEWRALHASWAVPWWPELGCVRVTHARTCAQRTRTHAAGRKALTPQRRPQLPALALTRRRRSRPRGVTWRLAARTMAGPSGWTSLQPCTPRNWAASKWGGRVCRVCPDAGLRVSGAGSLAQGRRPPGVHAGCACAACACTHATPHCSCSNRARAWPGRTS